MQLTSEIVYGFSKSLLAKQYDEPVPIPDLHREMWDMCCSEEELVAIAAPRGHAKSTAITHAYVLASVLHRDSSHVVIVSNTEELSVNFLEDIKREISTQSFVSSISVGFGLNQLKDQLKEEGLSLSEALYESTKYGLKKSKHAYEVAEEVN